MKVEKKEIQALQKAVSKRIDEIQFSANPDSAQLFDLNMLDSNISLFLLNAEFHDGPLELGPGQKHIIEALKTFRTSQSEKKEAVDFVEEMAVHASEIIDLIRKAQEKTKQIPEQVLADNFHNRLDAAEEILLQIARLKNCSKTMVKKWKTEVIPMPASVAGKSLGSIKSEKKAAASRKNGLKGGRPPKKAASSAKKR